MPGSVQSVERAAAIIRILASSDGPRPLGELAELLDLRKSTVHGLVRTLAGIGFVRQERATGDYVLADELAPMAPVAMDVHEMRARAMNWVDALAAKSGMSARLVVMPRVAATHVTGGVIVQHVFAPTRTRQRVETGEHLPLHCTAEGKVLLALDPRGAAVLHALSLEQRTHRSLRTRQDVRQDLDRVRRCRHAVDYGELEPDRGGVAAPVHGHGGIVVAALGVRGPLERIFTATRAPRPEVLGRLREAAAGTSRAVVAERW